MNTPKVSVVVPVYNNEDFVARCVDSILKQTYQNFEIIIIDDGSTDNTLHICKQYKNGYVHVHSKQNGGPSSARNYGIAKCATDSEFLLFVDSDDTINPDYIAIMVQSASSSWLNVCDINHQYETNTLEHHLITKQRTNHLEIRDIWDNEIFLKRLSSGIMNSSCNKCYSLNIVREHSLHFESDFPEDIKFNLQYLKHCIGVRFIDAKLYNYIHRPNSVTSSASIAIYDGYIKIQQQLYKLTSEKNHHHIDEFVYPQYLANTRKFVRSGNYTVPMQYLANRFVLQAIMSHRPANLGDFAVKYLYRFGLLNLLAKI